MLVLCRKVGQRIQIANGIVIVVKRIKGGRVTLGIDADVSTQVVRGELLAAPGATERGGPHNGRLNRRART